MLIWNWIATCLHFNIKNKFGSDRNVDWHSFKHFANQLNINYFALSNKYG